MYRAAWRLLTVQYFRRRPFTVCVHATVNFVRCYVSTPLSNNLEPNIIIELSSSHRTSFWLLYLLIVILNFRNNIYNLVNDFICDIHNDLFRLYIYSSVLYKWKPRYWLRLSAIRWSIEFRSVKRTPWHVRAPERAPCLNPLTFRVCGNC